MTKKKACKGVDCNDCLLKQKVKKQRIAKAKALLKPKSSLVKQDKQGNFDWARGLPKMQFIQKKREDRAITLGDLQNELRNFRLSTPNQQQVSTDGAVPLLREPVRETGLSTGVVSEPDTMDNLFERSNDRNETKYEDEMDNEDDTEEPKSLLTRGINSIFSFMNSAVVPEERTESLIPRSFELP